MRVEARLTNVRKELSGGQKVRNATAIAKWFARDGWIVDELFADSVLRSLAAPLTVLGKVSMDWRAERAGNLPRPEGP